jgi:hypothetical protein
MKKIFQYMIRFLIVNLFIITLSNAEDPSSGIINTIDNPAPGYMFLAPFTGAYFTLVDNSGSKVYSFIDTNKKSSIYDLNLQPNGLISFFDNLSKQFYLVNNNYSIVDSVKCVNGINTDFHDMKFLSNGNYVLLGEEQRVFDLRQYGDSLRDSVIVIGSVIQEFDIGHNLVFEWKALDHFSPLDVSDDNMFFNASIDLSHTNSIDVDYDGNYLISNRHMDEVTKISRSTGQIIWRWGGSRSKNNEFRFLNDTNSAGFIGFSHQHSVRRLPNGNILMFDNGVLKEPGYSRVVEYSLNEVQKTCTKVWEYRNVPDFYTITMGSVQRLDNGNTFICWGDANRENESGGTYISEVRPDGVKAFEIVYPHQLFYKAYKYIYKMDAVTLPVNGQGNYNFINNSYNTNSSVNINNITGNGKLTIERHYYSPKNQYFNSNVPSYT